MSKNPYEILGVSENSSQTAIDEAYYDLRSKYRNDMYQEGALGKEAAKKLTELEDAYREVCERQKQTEAEKTFEGKDGNADTASAEGGSKHSPVFATVEKNIRAKDFRAAQEALDDVNVRDAEWHYFQAVIYYNKGWMSEAKNQMEMAVNMEPNNAHYQNVLKKLNSTIEQAATGTGGNKGYNEKTQQSAQNSGYNRSYGEQDARQSEDMCCRWCEAMICMNCLCDCCCRG